MRARTVFVDVALLQVDLEKWVEPARPLSEAEKDRAFIVENNIFEVQPKHGCLAAGQAQQVSPARHLSAMRREHGVLLLRDVVTVVPPAGLRLSVIMTSWSVTGAMSVMVKICVSWLHAIHVSAGLHPLQPRSRRCLLPAAVPAHQRWQAAAATAQRTGCSIHSAAGAGRQGQP